MAKKLTIKGLERMIREEVKNYEKDVEAAAAKTKEVDADEYADTLEKHEDHTPAESEPKAPSMKTTAESIRRADRKLFMQERKVRKALAEVRQKRASLKKKYNAMRRRRR